MPRKGQMWNYFSVIDDKAKKAKCKYCKKILSFKTTVSNLKNHLKLKHSIIYEEICRRSNSYVNENSTRITNCDEPTGVDVAVTIDPSDIIVVGDAVGSGFCNDGAILSFAPPGPSTSTSNPQKQQETCRVKASNLSSLLSPHEKLNLDKSLLNMLAIDCQPFRIVDDEGFKGFIYGLNPNYTLPDSKTISTILLPREYEQRLAKIKSVVNTECGSMCITVDCWTSCTMQSYVAITGHFISKTTLELKSILIQCSLLDGTHAGENITQAVKSAIKEWNLESKINFFVSNTQNAKNLLEYPHYGCYTHRLNLVAQCALALSEVESSLSKVKETVVHFTYCSQAREKLIKYQVNSQGVAKESAQSLIMSMPKWWNTTFLMLQRFVHLQLAIRAKLPYLNVDLPVIDLQEWKCLEQFCEVLKPLYEATVIMSAENYLTASKAIVITHGLLNMYKQMSLNCNYYTPVQTLAKNINVGLEQKLSDIKKHLHITVSTFLDPRFKHFALDDETFIKTKTFIIDQICDIIGNDEPNPNSESSVPELSLWDVIEKKISASQKPRTTYGKVTEEVDIYMKQAVISRDSCPLMWWRDHKNIYPSLFSIIDKYLNIIVTSMPCAREFSKAGQLISDRRSTLTSSKVTQLMFLQGNQKFQ